MVCFVHYDFTWWQISTNGTANFIVRTNCSLCAYLIPTCLVRCFDVQVYAYPISNKNQIVHIVQFNLQISQPVIKMLERYVTKFSLMCTIHGKLIPYLILYNCTMRCKTDFYMFCQMFCTLFASKILTNSLWYFSNFSKKIIN